MTEIIQDYKPTTLETGLTNAITLHKDANIHSLEYLQANRDRFRGSFSTDSLTSFVDYVKAKKSSCDKTAIFYGFINADSMVCKVIHNLLNANNIAGHGDDRSILELNKTAAFRAVCSYSNTALSQDKLADFIEDWRDNIVACADKEGNSTVSVSKAIDAIKNISIKTNIDSDHSTDNFEQSKSSLAKIRAESKGEIPLPAYLEFNCNPYADLPEIKVKLVLYVRTNGDKPMITLRWAGEEKQLEEITESFKTKLIEHLKDDVQLSIGTFELGK